MISIANRFENLILISCCQCIYPVYCAHFAHSYTREKKINPLHSCKSNTGNSSFHSDDDDDEMNGKKKESARTSKIHKTVIFIDYGRCSLCKYIRVFWKRKKIPNDGMDRGERVEKWKRNGEKKKSLWHLRFVGCIFVSRWNTRHDTTTSSSVLILIFNSHSHTFIPWLCCFSHWCRAILVSFSSECTGVCM